MCGNGEAGKRQKCPLDPLISLFSIRIQVIVYIVLDWIEISEESTQTVSMTVANGMIVGSNLRWARSSKVTNGLHVSSQRQACWLIGIQQRMIHPVSIGWNCWYDDSSLPLLTIFTYNVLTRGKICREHLGFCKIGRQTNTTLWWENTQDGIRYNSTRSNYETWQ